MSSIFLQLDIKFPSTRARVAQKPADEKMSETQGRKNNRKNIYKLPSGCDQAWLRNVYSVKKI